MQIIIKLCMLFFFFIFFSSTTLASVEMELSKCLEIGNESEKISCFERLANNRLNQNLDPENESNWELTESQDDIDLSSIFSVSNTAIKATNTLFQNLPKLKLRCNSRDREIVGYINWHTYIGKTHFVKARLDDGPLLRMSWGNSTEETTSFIPERLFYDNTFAPKDYFGKKNTKATKEDFISALVDSNKLAISIEDYRETEISATFDLQGIYSAYVDLSEECKGVFVQEHPLSLLDPEIRKQFVSGTLTLKKARLGEMKHYWKPHANGLIKSLIQTNNWEKLVEILSVMIADGFHYYLLGISARELGYRKAAATYLRKSIDLTKKRLNRCVIGRVACKGYSLPRDAEAALLTLEN